MKQIGTDSGPAYVCTKHYTDIPFAHRQHRHAGHCQLVHGHNWNVSLTFGTETLDGNGFVLDLGGLIWIKEMLDSEFDHACVICESDPALNELRKLNAKFDNSLFRLVALPSVSVEGIAEYLYNKLCPEIESRTQGRVALLCVAVSENSRNGSTYTRR